MKHYKILIAASVTVFLASCSQSNSVTERNKNTILKIHEELLGKGNLAFADEAFASDYAFPGFEMKGPDLIRFYTKELKNAFPDLTYKIDRIVAEGDVVAWTRTCTGTHSADFMGYKPTGKTVTWQETDFSRFTEDGKVAQEWGVSDFDLNMSTASTIEGVYEYVGSLKGQTSIRNGRFVHLYGRADGAGQMTGEAGT